MIFNGYSGYDAEAKPSAAFVEALLDPTQLSGQDAQAYQYALNAAPSVMSGAIPDPTSGATYFFSGLAAPDNSNYALNPSGYLITFFIYANPAVFSMTFYEPVPYFMPVPPPQPPGGG